MMRLISVLLLAGCLALPVGARPVIVPLQQAAGTIDLVGDFTPGDPDHPAVLILHGFLTTYRFPTVEILHQSATDLSLATLTPNLSYGYSRRRMPLKCTSLHRHTVEDALAELDLWLKWLRRQGHEQVILIGHSSASTLISHYLARRTPSVEVRGVILTSLMPLAGSVAGIRAKELDQAREARRQNDTRPRMWHYQFCNGNYLATPKSFLSYQSAFSRDSILKSLRRVTERWPVYIILGGADVRLEKAGRDLISAYRDAGARVTVIEQANHFFTQTHEFDLQDRVEALLHELAQ